MGPARTDAEQFAELFRTIYLTYHRRDGKRSELANASRAVLTHLSLTGPVTVGEAAAHLARAQSVVSEIIDGLERKGWVERERDPDDGRRTLVWLTGAGAEILDRDGEVLDVARLTSAFAAMPAAQRDGLLQAARRLIEVAEPPRRKDTT